MFALCEPALARDRGADGEFSERRSSHFILRQDVALDTYSGHRGTRRFELDVLDTLESAYDSFGARFGIRPRRAVSVLIYDAARFDAEFGGLFRFSAAGFFRGVICIRGSTRVDAELVHVLHHEFVHAALEQAAPASLAIPGWVNEGLAEWFAYRALGKRGLSAGEAAYLSRAGGLPSLASLATPSFAGLSAKRAGTAYLTSYAAVAELINDAGESRFASFLADFLRGRRLERSLQRNYRLGVSELDATLARRFIR